MRLCRTRAFTALEMLVIVIIISIIISIALVVGRAVINSTRDGSTRAELKSLLGAEQSLVHETAGAVPDSMYDFLVQYQLMHAYKDPNGVWRMRGNFLTHLPPSMIKSTWVTLPNNGSMLMITQVNDAWGNAIQYISPAYLGSSMIGAHGPYFISGGEDGIINTADDIHSYDPE